jgi:UDP-N-acetylglucosamine 2-epimerase (non-hydrolysing)
VLEEHGLEEKRFFLATLHRAENVDLELRLRSYLDALESISLEYGLPVVCSLHPRTRSRLQQWGVDANESRIRFVPPLGFLDFLRLERSAFCVLSDSGTVQEECSILGVPSLTLRDVTERPETLESGSNVVAGADIAQIMKVVRFVTEETTSWIPPQEYLVPHVAETVARLLLGYRLQWPAPSEIRS